MQRQQYILAIVPEVHIEGTLAGQTLRDEFAPRLEFRMDELQIQLIKGDSSSGDSLKPSKTGLLKRTQAEPNTLGLLGLTLDVTSARWAALIGLALALAGAGVVGIPMLQTMRRDPEVRIRMKYGALIVDVMGADQEVDVRAIELASIDDLARLAEKHGAMILHQTSGPLHRYLVRDLTCAYVYQAGAGTGCFDTPPAIDIESQLADELKASEPIQPEGCVPSADPVEAPAAPPAHWKVEFLAALREHGCVLEACRGAGVSVASAYLERERVPAFAQAWSNAQSSARRQRY
jgi:hypothetical protein